MIAMEQCVNYLDKANGAVSRGDYLSAIQFALRAAMVPKGQEVLRCDAYMVLAVTSMEMEMGEEALSFAVGAMLVASWAKDEARQKKASALLSMVVGQFPHLKEERILPKYH